MKNFISSSSGETKKFAESFARRIINRKSKIVNHRGALVLAFTGELGSGKTTFVQGFFRGLGVRKRIASPTFIIMRRVALPRYHDHNDNHGKKAKSTRHRHLSLSSFRNAYHIDAYRIQKPKELLKIGFKEVLENQENIVLIEWADRIKKILPKSSIKISFAHEREEDKRFISISKKNNSRKS